MNILIKETGEICALSFIDWQDGYDYSDSILNSCGAMKNFLFDADADLFMIDKATYGKWNSFFNKYSDINTACDALGITHVQRASFDQLMHP